MIGIAVLTLLQGCAGPRRELVSPPAPEVLREPAASIKSPTKEERVVKVKIETTLGDIYAELYPEQAPKTVQNFVALAGKKFYDGIIFHRVIPDFMIQTGDPTGTGRGGPGYSFEDEFSPKLRHDQPGIFSMANSGPNTNGSQFFITEAATPWLDGRHSVFGRVTEGIDVVHQIAQVPRDSQDKPRQTVSMKKVTILEG